MGFPFIPKKSKKKKKSQCYVIGLSTLPDWSSDFKFISLGCFGVAMGFCYYGYCSACFVFNSCTGAFDDKSCWAPSQSGPELHRWLRNEGWAGEGGAGFGNSAPSSPLNQCKTELPSSFHLKPNQPLCLPRNAHWAWLYGPAIYFHANNCLISKSILNYSCITHITRVL